LTGSDYEAGDRVQDFVLVHDMNLFPDTDIA
jgi:hypothetical protein